MFAPTTVRKETFTSFTADLFKGEGGIKREAGGWRCNVIGAHHSDTGSAGDIPLFSCCSKKCFQISALHWGTKSSSNGFKEELRCICLQPLSPSNMAQSRGLSCPLVTGYLHWPDRMLWTWRSLLSAVSNEDDRTSGRVTHESCTSLSVCMFKHVC